MTVLAHLAALETALTSAGFAAMSPWWRATIERFYRGPQRQLVLRVGRRGGKSSTLCRLAVLEALFGDHEIPRGDVGIVGIVSVSIDEARQRLRTIRALLEALGIAWRPCDGGIELTDRPIAFRVFAATLGGVVGGTWIAGICDEVARWRDADSGANPASDVLASLRPCMATMPHARLFLSSSPFGLDDAHARAFDLGDTDQQQVAHAPTWIANPTITEEATRELEPDPRIHAREFAAVPQAGTLAAFDVDAVDRAMALRVTGQVGRAILVLDPSSGKKDAFTYAVARRVQPEDGGHEIVEVTHVGGFEGRFFDQLSCDQVVDRLAVVADEHKIRDVHADQREEFGLRSAWQSRGLRYTVHTWTPISKPAAIERLRRWFADGTLSLPAHERLRRELLAFEERLTPGGAFTFGARGSGHDDYVALLVTLAMVDLARSIPDSLSLVPSKPLPPLIYMTSSELYDGGRNSDDIPDAVAAQRLLEGLELQGLLGSR